MELIARYVKDCLIFIFVSPEVEKSKSTYSWIRHDRELKKMVLDLAKKWVSNKNRHRSNFV